METSGVIYMAEPPPGQVRGSGATLQPELIASGVATTIVALVTVLLRLFTRFKIVHNGLHFDDLLVVIAMFLSLIMLGVNTPLRRSGVGLHMWDVTFDQYNPGLGIWTLVTTCVYCLSITFSKLSILALYLRLSPQQYFRLMVHALLGLTVSYSVAYVFAIIFRCKPVAAGWDVSIPNPQCSNMLTVMMVLSIANIIMDVIILTLPIPVVLPLQMRKMKKASIMLIFATGGFVCAIAIKRTIQMIGVLSSPVDYTWNIVEQFHWSYLEVNLGILCASVPALQPFVKRYLGPVFSSQLRSSREDSKKQQQQQQPQPYSTAVRRNAERREAKLHGYELQSRDDRSEDGPFIKHAAKATAMAEEDEVELWRRDGAHHATAITSERNYDEGTDPGNVALVSYQLRQVSPQGISVIKEMSMEYNT